MEERMRIGQKIAEQRRKSNITQEQMASLMNVSRQAVSKWESDLAYPETDKIIRMSELFGCSTDYLLKDEIETDRNTDTEYTANSYENKGYMNDIANIRRIFTFHERKSEKTIHGMPLWHIAKNARGFVAIGLNATGVIAIGLKAQGVIALGFLAIGAVSIGLLSIGLAAFGCFALGLFSAGAICAGIFSVGAISVGIISIGAVSIGDFSFGALARGKYIAIGDDAKAMIAIGDTKAVGSVFEIVGKYGNEEAQTIRKLLMEQVPASLRWAAEIFKGWI